MREPFSKHFVHSTRCNWNYEFVCIDDCNPRGFLMILRNHVSIRINLRIVLEGRAGPLRISAPATLLKSRQNRACIIRAVVVINIKMIEANRLMKGNPFEQISTLVLGNQARRKVEFLSSFEMFSTGPSLDSMRGYKRDFITYKFFNCNCCPTAKNLCTHRIMLRILQWQVPADQLSDFGPCNLSMFL